MRNAYGSVFSFMKSAEMNEWAQRYKTILDDEMKRGEIRAEFMSKVFESRWQWGENCTIVEKIMSDQENQATRLGHNANEKENEGLFKGQKLMSKRVKDQVESLQAKLASRDNRIANLEISNRNQATALESNINRIADLEERIESMYTLFTVQQLNRKIKNLEAELKEKDTEIARLTANLENNDSQSSPAPTITGDSQIVDTHESLLTQLQDIFGIKALVEKTDFLETTVATVASFSQDNEALKEKINELEKTQKEELAKMKQTFTDMQTKADSVLSYVFSGFGQNSGNRD
jgi:hypothetical protein